MGKYFKKLNYTSIISCIISFFLGLFIVVDPHATLYMIVAFLGAHILINGIMKVISYFTYGYESTGFFLGIIEAFLGLFIFIYAGIISNAKILSILFGLIFILKAILKVQTSFEYKKNKTKFWWVNLIIAVVTFAFGIVVLINPFNSELSILRFIGIAVICESLLEFFAVFIFAMKIRKIKRTLKELFGKDEKEPIDITDYDNEIKIRESQQEQNTQTENKEDEE